MSEESDFCTNCGDELDGFAPCACGVQPELRRAPKPTKTDTARQIAFGGMRGMVSRKLKKQAARKETVG